MKRILMLLALAALAVAAGTGAARAGVVSSTAVSYQYAGFVPCANGGAGELMTGTIDARYLTTSTVNDNVDASQFHVVAHGELVGRVTGDSYRLAAVTQGTTVDHASGRSVLIYVNRYLLIGPGSGNNLVVRETAHVTRDGDTVIVERDDWSLDCT